MIPRVRRANVSREDVRDGISASRFVECKGVSSSRAEALSSGCVDNGTAGIGIADSSEALMLAVLMRIHVPSLRKDSSSAPEHG